MKVALITGASGGIGGATVKKFVSEGYFVLAAYNNGERNAEKLLKFLENSGLGGRVTLFKADLNREKDVRALSEKAVKDFGHVDALVNCAGIDLYKLFTETTEKEWDDVFNVNVKAAFMLSRDLLKGMIERKSGKIVFVSSVWGSAGASMEAAYSASKAALIGLTKALAKEVSTSGVNVNCVSPGVIDTPMNDCFTEEEKHAVKDEIPLGRFGTAEEVAELIYFLCSPAAAYITGQTITADGGFAL